MRRALLIGWAWVATLVPAMAGAATPAANVAVAEAATPDAAERGQAKVKYRKGKDIDFEELLIQGQLKRPEITVVTGNAAQGTDGLLRLRENFLDQMAMDLGEEVK